MAGWGDVSGVLTLPDGRRVRGTAAHRPRGAVPEPELAVYLLPRVPRNVPWPYRWILWRDFRTPASTDDAVATLREAHSRAAHERVEIACRGGIGRTGTSLAALAILSGIAPDDAVTFVRAHYHPRAVETRGQRRWLQAQAGRLH